MQRWAAVSRVKLQEKIIIRQNGKVRLKDKENRFFWTTIEAVKNGIIRSKL